MRKRIIRRLILPCILLILAVATILFYQNAWGFDRQVSEGEKTLRLEVVHTAESWLGVTPLPRDYAVTYEDAWCATFDSAVAIRCELTDIIPRECSCEEQIDLFRELGCWQEDDGYVPLPGDLIYYHWDCLELGDCSSWSDHVGIVVGTLGPLIKVIEGNKDNDVSYRITMVDAPGIRGYGLPDYESKV